MKASAHPDKIIKGVSVYMLSVGILCAVLFFYAPTVAGMVFFGVFATVGITTGLAGYLY